MSTCRLLPIRLFVSSAVVAALAIAAAVSLGADALTAVLAEGFGWVPGPAAPVEG